MPEPTSIPADPLGIEHRRAQGKQESGLRQLFLLGRFFGSRLKRRVSTCSKLRLEFFNTTCSIDELQFARVERMANIANVDSQLFSSASSDKRVPATTGNRGLLVVWVNSVFHDTNCND